MRKFRLINALGQSFDLMRKDAYFHEPQGLGFQQSLTYLRVGNHYELVESHDNQKAPSGQMVFRGYAQYKEFAQFISFKPLILVYNPQGVEYMLDCDVASLQKSEIARNGYLTCPISFLARGKWYFNRQALQTISSGLGTKTYRYTYPYVYSNSADGVIETINEGFDKAPCRLHIMGAIENPSWTLSTNNQTIAEGSCEATIPDGDKLVIDSRDGHLEVAEYTTNNEFVRNLYSACDYSKETFLYLPVGGFKILVQGIAEGINAYLEIFEQYDTV